MEGLMDQLEFDLTPEADVKLDPIAETALDLYRALGGELPGQPEIGRFNRDKNRHEPVPAVSEPLPQGMLRSGR